MTEDFKSLNEEQLPIAEHKLHGWKHILGLYAGEHVAATEFVIGATFVALGAKTMDIIWGLLIGNILDILSWTLITSPIAVDTRMSLYRIKLKNICQIEHSRHRRFGKFLVNIITGLIAYSFLPKKPSIKYQNVKTNQLTIF